MPESSLHFSVHVIDDHTVQVAMYIRLIQCKSVYFESYVQASKSGQVIRLFWSGRSCRLSVGWRARYIILMADTGQDGLSAEKPGRGPRV